MLFFTWASEQPLIIKIRVDLNVLLSEEGCYHHHAFRKNPRGRRQAKCKEGELVMGLVYDKSEESSVAMEDGNVKVSILRSRAEHQSSGLREGMMEARETGRHLSFLRQLLRQTRSRMG